jgi:hypothetical protein
LLPSSRRTLSFKKAPGEDRVISTGVHLWEASCGFCRWPIEVLFNGEGRMFLHTGWEKFARAHNLEVACLVNFKWEGDNELRVKVFDDTSCSRHYHNDNIDDIIDD